MKTKTQKDFARKWVGCVSAITGSNVVKFTSTDADKDGNIKNFPNDSETIKFNFSELPKEALRVIKPNVKTPKNFRIRLNEDADGVEAVTPVTGVFPAKLIELGVRVNETPVPNVKWYNKGQKDENSHLQFYASYEITDGVFKGVILPAYYLHYKFEEDTEDEGQTQFDTVMTAKASQLIKLQNWGTVHGNLFDEPIPWNPEDAEGVDNEVVDVYGETHDCEFANILPILEERALEADRAVNVVIEKGYIASIQAQENYEDESEDGGGADEELSDDEFDEKFPTKKAPKTEEVKVAKPAAKKAKKPADDDDDL